MCQERLKDTIVEISDSDEWDDARVEWALHHIWVNESGQQCVCGHNPINNVCVIENAHNGEQAEVGINCLNRFLDTAAGRILAALFRVERDIDKTFNGDAIKLAYDRGAIDEDDRDFGLYVQKTKMKKLSESQKQRKRDLNRRLVRFLRHRLPGA